MPQFDHTNRGRLFKNDRKGDNEKAPDYKGDLDIEGQVFEVAGWIRTSQKGTKYLSLAIKKKVGWVHQEEGWSA